MLVFASSSGFFILFYIFQGCLRSLTLLISASTISWRLNKIPALLFSSTRSFRWHAIQWENGIIFVFNQHLWLVFIWCINSTESKHHLNGHLLKVCSFCFVMIHKSPDCENQRLSIFGYPWPWWTFYQWHLPSCPGFSLSTGAFPPSTFDLTSCPSINVSSLSFWQMPAEEQGNITRCGFVCVCLVSLQSGLAGCNQCCFVQWASSNDVQMPKHDVCGHKVV